MRRSDADWDFDLDLPAWVSSPLAAVFASLADPARADRALWHLLLPLNTEARDHCLRILIREAYATGDPALFELDHIATTFADALDMLPARAASRRGAAWGAARTASLHRQLYSLSGYGLRDDDPIESLRLLHPSSPEELVLVDEGNCLTSLVPMFWKPGSIGALSQLFMYGYPLWLCVKFADRRSDFIASPLPESLFAELEIIR